MSRTHIGLGVAAIILAVTAVLYFTVPSSLENHAKAQVKERVGKAAHLAQRNALLDAIYTSKQAEQLAANHEEELIETLQIPKDSADERYKKSSAIFAQMQKEEQEQGAAPPAVLAVYDSSGEIAMREGASIVTSDDWTRNHKLVKDVLSSSKVVGSKDTWKYRGEEYIKVGVAPLFSGGKPMGALLVGYVIDEKGASDDAKLFGAEVAYFIDGEVRVSSLGSKGKEKLTAALKSEGVMDKALEQGSADKVITVWIGDSEYLATAAAVKNYETKTVGAAVMISLTAATDYLARVRLAIALLGLGALVVSVLGIFLTARTILAPAEEIELGVSEIINGNIDYVFKPVGGDFDGLANALNVMLARIMGRPEPGEEGDDEDGAERAQVMLGEIEDGGKATTDPETLALAQEPEPAYYARVFDEYVKARAKVGEKGENVTFEGFVAKLRVNELNLKKKYSCRAVRFRVVVSGTQVTLKPVPIY